MGVTAVSRVARGGLSGKGTFPQALERSEWESQGRVQGHGYDMEDVLEGEAGSRQIRDGAIEIQVTHH